MVRKLELVEVIKPSTLEPTIKEEKKPKKDESIWARLFKKNPIKKPNQVYVLYKRLNGTIEPGLISTDSQGMFSFNDKTYHIRGDCRYDLIYDKKKYPVLVVNEEGLIPEGTKEYYALEFERRCAEHQDTAIKAIRHAELVRLEGEGGSKVNAKLVIGIIIAAVIGLALLKNYI